MSTAADPGFVHVYRPAARPSTPVLLLLHGTGGDEQDLLPLGEALAPGAALLSPRGKVVERGMPRFFRRLAEGVFDVDDLKQRAGELAEFVESAAGRYGFERQRVIAVGLSNGANIASAVLLLHPTVLSGAVLYRGMVPLVPDPLPAITSQVLISNGRADPLVSPEETERLADLLRRAGANVDLWWSAAGHQLTEADVNTGRDWLSRLS